MRYLRTNTATRVTVGPFLDKTDGITPEVALTVTAEKLTFVVDTGGVPTLVLDVAPTASGGANDMVHITGDDAGFYDLELAAADVNYLGRAMLSLNDVSTHCPVFHEFMIIPAVEYDAKILGTDVAQVDVTQWRGTNVDDPTVEGVPNVNVKTWNDLTTVALPLTPATAGRTLVVDAAGLADANVVKVGPTGSGIAQTAGDILAKLLNYVQLMVRKDAAIGTDNATEVTAINANEGSGPGAFANTTDALEAIRDKETDIETDTAVIGALGAGLTGIPWNTAWDAEVESEVNDALVVHRLDELLNADSDIDGVAPPTVGSVFHELLTKTAGSFTYDQSTDSLEAIRDKETDIETDTAEIGAAGAGLTNIGTIATCTNLTNAPTNGDLTATMKTSVNAEVVDAIATDAYAEPGQGAPPATTNLALKLSYLYKFLRNKKTQDATTLKVFADDAVTVDQKATLSDDATTYTHGEIVGGP